MTIHPEVIIRKGVELYVGYRAAQEFIKARPTGHGMASLIGYDFAGHPVIAAYRTKAGTIVVRRSD